MRRSRQNTIGGFFLAALLSVPALGANPAQPGMVNYIQGHVTIGNQALDPNSVGSAELQAGQSLTTGKGKAEILLTPGVFFRLADNSSVTMVSPDLANTEVRLTKGRAIVEVADIHKENHLIVDENGTVTRLLKKGLYDFDADRKQVRVFDGQASVRTNSQQVKLKGGHVLDLNGPAKSQKFKKQRYEDSFYRWASLRSDYLSEANVDAARSYLNRGNVWVGAGWYWDPFFGAYTFIPGGGTWYSPFGWSYYPPWRVYGVPYAYYGNASHHFDRDFGRESHFANRGFEHHGSRSAFGPRPGTEEMHENRSIGGFHGLHADRGRG